jgi:hypothetical protein
MQIIQSHQELVAKYYFSPNATLKLHSAIVGYPNLRGSADVHLRIEDIAFAAAGHANYRPKRLSRTEMRRIYTRQTKMLS